MDGEVFEGGRRMNGLLSVKTVIQQERMITLSFKLLKQL